MFILNTVIFFVKCIKGYSRSLIHSLINCACLINAFRKAVALVFILFIADWNYIFSSSIYFQCI